MLPHDRDRREWRLILWFGWYGLTRAARCRPWISRAWGVATNTTLAACAAGLMALSYTYVISKKWDISFTVNGFWLGLLPLRPCYWVSPTGGSCWADCRRIGSSRRRGSGVAPN